MSDFPRDDQIISGGPLEQKRRYGNRPREDKETLSVPKCPFCAAPFERPSVIRTGLGSILGGTCGTCGAVFVCDESGKNLGEVYMDALVFAAGGDWDRAMALVPGEDYVEATFDYSSRNHTVPVVKRDQRFETAEKIVFIKLSKPL